MLFFEARDLCDSLEGFNLVCIESEEENALVTELIRGSGPSATWWTSGYYLSSPEKWVWEDSDVEYTNWEEGQPLDHDNGVGKKYLILSCDDDCKDGEADVKWSTSWTEPDKRRAICERKN